MEPDILQVGPLCYPCEVMSEDARIERLAFDIANTGVFLASDASSYTTGQTLSVNAGLFMA